ncbi:MAG TPA: hypothetical protein VKU00_27540, partial [Chthonomonadaceae bacterium]|nr:hypothetical protein [Chthonomonadaceae bacterium]
MRSSLYANATLWLAIMLFCLPAGCLAQNKPATPSLWERPISLQTDGQSFLECLKALQARAPVNFLADGAPVRAFAAFSSHGDLSDAIDSLADSFDYTWKPGPGSMVLLIKRFRDPFETPQTHLSELRAVATDLLSILHSFNVDPVQDQWDGVLLAFANSLTPQQTQSLKSGSILRGWDLQPQQFALLNHAILCNML